MFIILNCCHLYWEIIKVDDGDSCSKWLIGILGPLVGALIGVLGSLLIFNKTIKSDKRIEEDKKLELQKELLKYFAVLIKNVIDDTNLQIEYYYEFIQLMKSNIFVRHKIKGTSKRDINRIQEELSQENIFKAYMSSYGKKNEDIKTIKRFANIYEPLDRLYILKPEFTKKIDAFGDAIQKDKVTFINMTNELSKQINEQIKLLKSKPDKTNEENEMLKVLNNFIAKYNIPKADPETQDDSRIKYIHDNLLLDKTLDIYRDSNFVNGREFAKVQYQKIEYELKDLVLFIEKYLPKFEGAIKDLTEHADDLLKSIQ
jgi:gas vesicle protein